MTDLYYIDPVPSSEGISDNKQTTLSNGSINAGVTEKYVEQPKLVMKVESVEKAVKELMEKTLKLDENGRLNNLEVKNNLTAFFGKIGGWLIENGILSTPSLKLDSNNEYFRSVDYNPGVQGFTVQRDLVEAQNIRARGSLQGSTFSYDKISAVGGQLMVVNADVLEEDMSALDSAKMVIKGDTTFAVNDILVMRGVATSGVQEEWFRVTAVSGNTYTVTRDLASSFAANANPKWKKGTPVVEQGSSDGASTYSGGWLRLLGEGTNSPYYSVYRRTGVAYNAYTEIARFGNLNGIGGISNDYFGIFIGNYSSGQYLRYDTNSGELIVNDSVLSNEDRFGDGDDGDVTISGGTTLTSDMYYNSLTVNSGITLNTGGYRIFVKTTLTNNGIISRDGNNGGNGANANALIDTCAGGTAGAALATGTIYGGEAGKVGADGVFGDGTQNAGAAGTAGDSITVSFASNGTAGGSGGNYGNPSYPGGAGGAGGTATQTIQPIRNYVFATIMREFSADDTVKYIKSSAGSGSGGSGSVNALAGASESGAGGGSGSTGGIVFICAKKIINSATGAIRVNGGNGGNAGNPSGSSNGVGGSGGGAGGSGGLVYLVYQSLTNSGTIESAGGSGGTASSGINGGTNGVDGADGGSGVIIQLKI